MDPILEGKALFTRRQFFGKSVMGLGTAALASLLNKNAWAADPSGHGQRKAVPGLPHLPHFAPKAKRVIYLFQNGAPSHVDLFDYKPALKQWHGNRFRTRSWVGSVSPP